MSGSDPGVTETRAASLSDAHDAAVARLTGHLADFDLRPLTTLSHAITPGRDGEVASRIEVESILDPPRGRSYVLVRTRVTRGTNGTLSFFSVPVSSLDDSRLSTSYKTVTALQGLAFPSGGTVSNAEIRRLVEASALVPPSVGDALFASSLGEDPCVEALRWPVLATTREVEGARSLLDDLDAGAPIEWLLRRLRDSW